MSAAPVLVSDAVVDVPGRRVVRALTRDVSVYVGAIDGDVAYLIVSFFPVAWVDRTRWELRSYDLADGSLRWSRPLDGSGAIAASAGGVLVGRYPGGAPGATWFARRDGASRTVAPGAPVRSLQRFGEDVVAVHEDGAVDLLAGDDGRTIRSLSLPFVPEERFPGDTPFSERDGELRGVRVDGVDVEAACIDASFRVRYTLRESVGPGAYLRERGPRWALAALGEGRPRSVVVDLASGSVVARVDAEVAATVRDEAGDLDGFLTVDPPFERLDRRGQRRWKSPRVPSLTHRPWVWSASATTKDGAVFAAVYMTSCTGAVLFALDEDDGSLRWNRPIELLPIAHSRYSNHVDLDFDQGLLAVRGHETGLDHFGLYDPSDGAPVFSVVRE